MTSDLYDRAMATSAHEGQIRKIDDSHTEAYVEHPIRVAEMVLALTASEEMAAAALLHDVLEDTSVGMDQIAREFGWTVTTIVVALTDRYTKSDYPEWNREKRKGREAKRLGDQSLAVRLIKICDCIDNGRSIEAIGGDFAEVWRAELAVLLPLLMGEDQ